MSETATTNMSAGKRYVEVSQSFTFTPAGNWPERIAAASHDPDRIMRPESVHVEVNAHHGRTPNARTVIRGPRILKSGADSAPVNRTYWSFDRDKADLAFAADCEAVALAAFSVPGAEDTPER